MFSSKKNDIDRCVHLEVLTHAYSLSFQIQDSTLSGRSSLFRLRTGVFLDNRSVCLLAFLCVISIRPHSLIPPPGTADGQLKTTMAINDLTRLLEYGRGVNASLGVGERVGSICRPHG